MPSFPSSLPLPLIEGYSIQPLDQVIRTDMETGAPRARRRTKARLDRLSVRWRLSDAQMQIFRSWFSDDVNGAGGGSIYFSIPLRVGTGGIATNQARIVRWEASLLSPSLWEVAAELEVR